MLKDSVFERMTFDQWKRATLPKLIGTTNLGKLLPENLSFFVLLSSVTGVAGHSSQANYAAGNTFQDAFARHRVVNGQAAISIDLPAVTGAGVVANDDSARKRIEALGSKSISIQSILNLLDKVIHRRSITPDEAQIIVNLEPWTKLAPEAVMRRDRRFGTLRLRFLRGEAIATGGLETKSLSPSALLTQALGQCNDGKSAAEEIRSAVARAIATRLAAIFSLEADEVDFNQPLAAHGVDSLVAVELRNWLAAAGGVKISIFEILQATSLHQIAALIIARRETK
jgi:acyl carrier protein